MGTDASRSTILAAIFARRDYWGMVRYLFSLKELIMKRLVALMLLCAAVVMLGGCDCGSIKNWGPGPMHLAPIAPAGATAK